MVTKSPTNSLLTKFAQLFRDTGPTDADTEQSTSVQAAMAAEHSFKQILKYKRRNDAIRAKELSYLRKIIREGSGIRAPRRMEATVTAALSRSKKSNTQERTSILDKIDGAEAHLEQWWGKPSEPITLTQTSRAAPLEAQAPAQREQPDVEQPTAWADDFELDFTAQLPPAADGAPEEQDGESGPIPIAEEEAALSADETCLRDAALHYAEGEFDAAHDILAARLADPLIDADTAELLTFALFDVYRCNGDQERFDALALDYANRFGRSPGEWFSVPDIVAAQSLAHAPAANTPGAQPLWQCPETLDTEAWADCLAHNPNSGPTCAINWEALRHVDAAQAPALAEQLHAWRCRPVELHWSGVEALLAALKARQTQDDAAGHATWWLMHLDLLCILQQPEAFDEVALDYCVRFEVSPPSWTPPRCQLLQADDATEHSGFVVTLASKAHSGTTETDTPYALCELQGNITGEASFALHQLNHAAMAANQLAVSCAHLGRVDFNAASALLNWVVECDAKGCEVRFIRLPRLVSLFFQLLGMHQFASLSTGAR